MKNIDDMRKEFAETITANLSPATLHKIAEQGSELLKMRDGEEWKLLQEIYQQAMERIVAR